MVCCFFFLLFLSLYVSGYIHLGAYLYVHKQKKKNIMLVKLTLLCSVCRSPFAVGNIYQVLIFIPFSIIYLFCRAEGVFSFLFHSLQECGVFLMESDSNFFNNKRLRLFRQDGSVVLSEDAFEGYEYVLVLLAAHRSARSRKFVPLLKQFYKEHHKELNFEVVFMSLDKSDVEMQSCFAEEHGDWLRLGHLTATSMAPVWQNTYGAHEVPSLLVFHSPQGGSRQLMTRSGRHWLEANPDGKGFPWAGMEAKDQSLYCQYVALVLSLEWCPDVLKGWIGR